MRNFVVLADPKKFVFLFPWNIVATVTRVGMVALTLLDYYGRKARNVGVPEQSIVFVNIIVWICLLHKTYPCKSLQPAYKLFNKVLVSK